MVFTNKEMLDRMSYITINLIYLKPREFYKFQNIIAIWAIFSIDFLLQTATNSLVNYKL